MYLKMFCFNLLILSVFVLKSNATPELECSVEKGKIPFTRTTTTKKTRFNVRLPSSDRHHRTFRCKCLSGSGCERVTCEQLFNVQHVDISHDGTSLSPEDNDKCYDAILDEYYLRGSTYMRPGNPREGCECPLAGDPVSLCEPLQCKYDIGPKNLLNPPKHPTTCINPWKEDSILDEMESFNHTMIINKYQMLVNTLTCRCEKGLVMCQLLDHLCCDERSGELIRVGHQFHKSHPSYGFVMCGCHPVEMQCTLITTTQATTTTTPFVMNTSEDNRPGLVAHTQNFGVPTRPNRPRGGRKRTSTVATATEQIEDRSQQCYHEERGVTLKTGQKFAYASNKGKVFECLCKARKRKRKPKLKCKKLA